MSETTILVVGTYDTKDDELTFLAERIRAGGGRVLTMDVSILGEPRAPCDISKHAAIEAGGGTIAEAAAAGDENAAMQMMARGAALTAARLHAEGRVDGAIVLGGTMGTDLALDLCAALPLGVPKYVVSTVAFSPLLPPDRLAPDIQMILWAGGLYGLNAICRSSLAQAAGAVLGAARAAMPPRGERPLVGMTSFGTTVLRYVVPLKPALEVRGYEVAVFHATGMGGRAFEALAAQGAFACVMDFAPQEVSNHLLGGLSAGADRMRGAGRSGTPQIVAPGCYDLVDVVGWQPAPPALAGRPSHAHNRLLSSYLLDAGERERVARAHCEKLSDARARTAYLLPELGANEWDREGAELHDASGLAAFRAEIAAGMPENVELHRLPCHINDAPFAEKALEVFDRWRAEGVVAGGA